MAKVTPHNHNDSIRNEKEFHLMTFEELRRKFDLDLSTGLSSERANALLHKYGKNQIKISYFRLIKAISADLVDYLSIMLWLSVILSIISYRPLGNPPQISNLITACVLLGSLLAKAFLAGYQSYHSIRSMRGFQMDKDAAVHVLRDSSCKLIQSSELVLGDVIYLMPNQRVPAAVRLIEANGLVLDKSALTGETDYVEGSAQKCNLDNKVECFDSNNMAFPNCLVVHGDGVGVVVALVTNSQFGFGMNSSYLDLKPSKYSAKGGVVRELGQFVFIIIVICVIGVLVYLVVLFAYILPNYSPSAISIASDSVQILVSGIPIGAPIAVTVALFLTSRSLKKRNILVKDVFAIDSLSSIDVIITDKTGTLTRNELKVSNVLYSTKEIDADLCFYDPVVYMGVDEAIRELLMLCYFNKNKFAISDSIDSALYSFFKKNMKIDGLSSAYKDVDEIAFSNTNKYHVKLIRPTNLDVHLKIYGVSDLWTQNKMGVLMARGAPEILLKKCSHIMEPDGTIIPLTENKLRDVQEKLVNWSFRGLRCVALCRMFVNLIDVPTGRGSFSAWFKTSCVDLCFVGMMGFVDPPKQDIHESIGEIRKLGVRVVMATGDYSITAGSIARQVGILSSEKYDNIQKMRQPNRIKSNAILLNGSEIDTLTNHEWSMICRDYTEIVLSRSAPHHKLRCVREFQAIGSSVLMAGDGANDVPALKTANLSVAMGSGNRIAADIADIILLDNNFAYIPELVNTGKQTFYNIKKMFLYFTIVSTFSQVFTTMLTAIIGIPNPYSILVGTIMSMITDAIPAVTFIYDKLIIKNQKGEEMVQRLRRKERLVDWRLILLGFITRGPLITFFLYANFLIYISIYTKYTMRDFLFSYKVFFDTQTVLTIQSISFYSAVCVQSFGNIWAIRSLNVSILKMSPFSGPTRNLPMVFSSVGVYLFTIALINLPHIRSIFGFVHIPWFFYIIPFGYAFIMVLINELRLLLVRVFKLNEKFFVW